MGGCTSRKPHLEPEDLVPSETSVDSFTSSYSLEEQLGAGGFGEVFRVKHHTTQRERVAKRIKTRSGTTSCLEVTLMLDLHHPNIIRLLEHFTLPSHRFLILEYLPGSMDLFDYIERKGRLAERNTRYILQQLTSALSYLHEVKQIAHLDVKPENLLISPTTGGVKLIDFGAAQHITPYLSTTFSGTRQYASPEILFSSSYDPVLADMWGLGVTFYKMVTGHLPFRRTRDYLAPLKIHHLPLGCRDILLVLLNPNPLMRPQNVADFRSSVWMRS